MFKKRKEKIVSDKSTVDYWSLVIKPRMKLNNSNLLISEEKYANFIVPNNYIITYRGSIVAIFFKDIRGIDSWYYLYKDGISAKIIQEDIMSPKTDNLMPF